MARKELRNCILIDGVTPEPIPDAVVAVDGDRIVWVGPAGAWTESRIDDESVDMKGTYSCRDSGTCTCTCGTGSFARRQSP